MKTLLVAIFLVGAGLAADDDGVNNQLNTYGSELDYDLAAQFNDGEDKLDLCDELAGLDFEAMKDYNTYIDLTQCDDQSKCPTKEELDALNFEVFTFNMKCFKDACDGQVDTDGEPLTFGRCVDKLMTQQKDQLQFVPEDKQKQMDKSCSCEYQNQENLSAGEGNDKVSVCDFKYTYNKALNGDTNMNAFAMMTKEDYCGKAEGSEERAKAANRTEERVEYFRVRELCNPQMSSILGSENIVPPRCEENDVVQTRLKSGCSNQCYYNPVHESFNFDTYSYDLEPDESYYQFFEDFDAQCGQFTAEDGKKYHSDTVYHIGSRRVWHQVLDFCQEFREGGSDAIPDTLQFTPVTRNINPVSKMRNALDSCCKPNVEDYKDIEKRNDDVRGKGETECLYNNGVMVDMGFLPSLMRGVISKSTNQCWEYYSPVTECSQIERPEEEACSGPPTPADQMQLRPGQMGPEEIFWFLKYESDPIRKAVCMKACGRGAKLGKAVTTLPGLALGLEAQNYALSTEVPINYQIHAMLAFHVCGVYASVHYNNYFDITEADTCNPYALKWDAVNEYNC